MPPSEVRRLHTVDGGWGWVVCFGCFVVHIILGGLQYSYGILYVEFLEYFGRSKSETAWIASILVAASKFAAPAISATTNRFGCRTVSLLGTVIYSGGYIISSFASNLYFLYLSYGVLVGIGYGAVQMSSVVALNQFFQERLPIATGIAVSGTGLGTFLFGPVTNLLITKYTWRGALLIHGGLGLNCFVISMLYRKPDYMSSKYSEAFELCSSPSFNSTGQNDCIEEVHGSEELKLFPKTDVDSSKLCAENEENEKKLNTNGQDDDIVEDDEKLDVLIERSNDNYKYIAEDIDYRKSSANRTIRETKEHGMNSENNGDVSTKTSRLVDFTLLRQRPFQFYIISSMFFNLGFFVFFSYIVDTARNVGISSSRSAWLISATGISNTLNRILIGSLGNHRRVNVRYLFGAMLILFGIGTALVPLSKSFIILVLLSVLCGGCAGGFVTLVFVLIVDLVGPNKFSDALGIGLFISAIASTVGPPFAGLLFDITGSYLATYLFGGGTLIVGGLIILLPNKQKK